MAKLTFEEKRLAVICFNHVQSQWIWNMGKLVLEREGRGAARAFVKKKCKHFGSFYPGKDGIKVQANDKRSGMTLHRGQRLTAELTWNGFVDFMDEYRCCPRSTADIDVEDLMSVF